MGKTKNLSKDCKNIMLNLFKFVQLAKARGSTSTLAVKIGENVKFQMSAAIMKGYCYMKCIF
jgi:hypothetical protein